MQVTSYNGVTFASLNVQASTYDQTMAGPDRFAVTNPRLNNFPAFAGIEKGPQIVPVHFTVKTGTNVDIAKATLLGALDVGSHELKTLAGVLTDETEWETQAAVLSWRHGGQTGDVKSITVDFLVPSGQWDLPAAVVGAGTAFTADGTLAIANDGYRTFLPYDLAVLWDGATNRASSSAATGWTYKRDVVLTNNGEQTIENAAIQLGPWDTATLVTASKMQADADDLRIYLNGVEQPRKVIAPNTSLTFVWFVPRPLAPGASATYEVVYGNSAGGQSPKEFSFDSDPPLPAIDISGETFTATASGSSSVTTSGTPWRTNEWAGGMLWISNGRHKRIVSNTANVLTIEGQFVSAPATSLEFVLSKSGTMADSGRSDGAATTTVTDSTSFIGIWTDDEWVGATVEVFAGTGSGQTRTVTGNTSDSFTVSSAFSPALASNSQFTITKPNGQLLWEVRQDTTRPSGEHAGLWSQNRTSTRPSRVEFDHPQSWSRGIYRRNNDAYFAARTIYASGDYFATMYIQRAREGKRGNMEEVGVADSIQFNSPFPIQAFYGQVEYKNPPKSTGTQTDGSDNGMAKFVLAAQEAGGEDWDELSSWTTVQSALTGNLIQRSLIEVGSPLRLAWAVIPNDFDDIPDTEGQTATLTSDSDYWRIAVDASDLSVTDIDDATEVEVYDLELDLRLGGGASPTPPYHLIQIGGEDRKVFLAALDGLRINADERTASIDPMPTGLLITSRLRFWYVDADSVEQIAADWCPVPIGGETLYVDDPSGAGWGSVQLHAYAKPGGYF
jgi:hypothetical protein